MGKLVDVTVIAIGVICALFSGAATSYVSFSARKLIASAQSFGICLLIKINANLHVYHVYWVYSLAWHCQGLMYHLYFCYFLSCCAVASVVHSKQSCSCHSRLQTTMAPDTITLYQPVHQQLSPTSHFLWLPQVSYMYAVSVSIVQAIVCTYLELES